ncbi:glycosyl transferases group 1 family protein [Burkholderia cenocepacia]|nr:glycosyl transferases group 1 family protein [Burkholderia cenocepacia]
MSTTNYRKIRVLHAAETIKGGVAAVLRQLLDERDGAAGVETVACLVPADQRSELKQIGSGLIRTYERTGRDAISLWRFYRAFNRVLIQERPDVVHLHCSFTGVIGRVSLLMLRRRVRPRVVYCPHAFSFLMQTGEHRRAAYALIEKVLSYCTDRIICVSEHERLRAIDAGLPAAKLSLVYNGVSSGEGPRSVDERVGRSETRLLFVGRFDRQKGFDVLMDAMKRLEGEPFHLTVVGGSVLDRTTVPERINVDYRGWLDADGTARAFREADVVVVPSRWEGFAMVPLEAMSHGLPVIASDCSSFPEMIVDGFNGLLFERENSDALVACIRSGSKERWMQMGRNGYAFYMERFTREKMVDSTRKIYAEVADEAVRNAFATRPEPAAATRPSTLPQGAALAANAAPLVTVYIPTRNRLSLLRRAVESVLAQTYPHIELIVADDGSTDGSREYLDELSRAGRLRMIALPTAMGACVARNMALSASTGDFITGLDDDDYFLPERVATFVEHWLRIDTTREPVAGLFHPARMLKPDGEMVLFSSAKVTPDELKRQNKVGNNVFAPRAHYFGAGMFDPAMPCWQDWDLWARMSERFGVFLGGDRPTYVWDQSTPTGHITGRPEFQVRYAFSLFSHKLRLDSRRQRTGPLGAMTLYPQVTLTLSEVAMLLLSDQWRFAFRYIVRKILGARNVSRIRTLITRNPI